MSHTPVGEAESMILHATFFFLNWASVDFGRVFMRSVSFPFYFEGLPSLVLSGFTFPFGHFPPFLITRPTLMCCTCVCVIVTLPVYFNPCVPLSSVFDPLSF